MVAAKRPVPATGDETALEVEWFSSHTGPLVKARVQPSITKPGWRLVLDHAGGARVFWISPEDPEESKRMDEAMLNLCYARYGRGD